MIDNCPSCSSQEYVYPVSQLLQRQAVTSSSSTGMIMGSDGFTPVMGRTTYTDSNLLDLQKRILLWQDAINPNSKKLKRHTISSLVGIVGVLAVGIGFAIWAFGEKARIGERYCNPWGHSEPDFNEYTCLSQQNFGLASLATPSIYITMGVFAAAWLWWFIGYKRLKNAKLPPALESVHQRRINGFYCSRCGNLFESQAR